MEGMAALPGLAPHGWKFSGPQRCADCADVEKHPLWAAFRGTFNRHKTVSCIPADPVPIRVCDDAAATYFIRHAQTDAERFGDQRVPETPPGESPVHSESC